MESGNVSTPERYRPVAVGVVNDVMVSEPPCILVDS